MQKQARENYANYSAILRKHCKVEPERKLFLKTNCKKQKYNKKIVSRLSFLKGKYELKGGESTNHCASLFSPGESNRSSLSLQNARRKKWIFSLENQTPVHEYR